MTRYLIADNDGVIHAENIASREYAESKLADILQALTDAGLDQGYIDSIELEVLEYDV